MENKFSPYLFCFLTFLFGMFVSFLIFSSSEELTIIAGNEYVSNEEVSEITADLSAQNESHQLNPFKEDNDSLIKKK